MTWTVHIIPLDLPGGDLVLPMGQDIPRFTDGIADWSEVNRPRRRNYLEYRGEKCGKLTFDVMLNQWPDGDVEGPIRQIVGWAARSGLFQPTRIRIDGPVPYPDLTYVMTKCDDSGIVERRNDGVRCRQQLKLEFTEYVAPDLIIQTPAAVANAAAAAPKPLRTYTVMAGDSLGGIAARVLGDMTRWTEIADLNNIRDPKLVASVGKVLVLPS